MRDPDCGMCTGNPELLSLCDRCAKNLELLDLSDAVCEVKGEEGGFVTFGDVPTVFADSVPADSLFLVPSRWVLEQALEHDEAPDLRRYFGVIANIG